MNFMVSYPSSDEREWVEYFKADTVAEAHIKAKEMLPKDTFVDKYHLKIQSPPVETVYLDEDEQFIHAVVRVRCNELDKEHNFTVECFGLDKCQENAIAQAKNVWGADFTYEVLKTERKYIQLQD